MISKISVIISKIIVLAQILKGILLLLRLTQLNVNYLRRFAVLFAHKTNIKKLAIVLIGSGLLAACNQAGNGSTSANAPQHVAVESTKKTQKMLRMVNNTGSTIDRVNIVSKSGTIVFKSNTGIGCLNNQDCNININGLLTSKDMLAKFYNSKNQLISMAQLKDNLNQLTYMTVYVNNLIFGTNLFKHLVTYENSTPVTVFGQLTKYFKHDKNNHNNDLFQDLGNYYAQELKSGHITGEEAFYHKLSTSFASHQTVLAPISQTSQPKLMATSGCDNATGNTVFNFLTPFSYVPEVGFAIGLIAGEAKAIFNVACPAAPSNIQSSFDQINKKLDQSEGEIGALGTDIAALRSLVIVQNEDTVNVSMEKLYNNENSYNLFLSNFLFGVGKNSLFDYVESQGGIDNLNKQDLISIFDTRVGIVGSISDQNKNIRNLTSPTVMKQLTDLIHAKCSDYSKITDAKGNPVDILAATDVCNLQVIQTGYYLAALSQQSRLRMLDIARAVNTSKNPAYYPNNFSYLNKPVIWADVPKIIEQDNTTRVESASEFIQKNAIFLPRQYLESMNIQITAESGCFIASRFEKTKVLPDFMTWNNNNYDSITVGASCNGKKLEARPLLPGGIYHIDASKNKIIMDNAESWEKNEKINPFISPEAATLGQGDIERQLIVAVWGNQGGKYAETGDITWVKNSLIAEGRNEFADFISDAYQQRSNIKRHAAIHTLATKLFLPYSLNFDGYHNITIWMAKGYGARADIYGSSDKTNALMIQFNGKNYLTGNDAFVNVQGWRRSHPYAGTSIEIE